MAAPTNLAYSTNPAVYTTGTAIAANSPSSGGGAVASFTVAPALPAGLSLSSSTGVISGTPTVATPTATYVVTATNAAGKSTFNLTITVNAARLRVTSFSVGSDIALTYPNTVGDPNRLLDLADEHSTFIPLGTGPNAYLVFASSKVSSGPTGGAVVLQTNDLVTFTFATALGYNRQVFRSPVPIDGCDPAYASEFDENYAAPGSVVQDPTLPAGNLIMLYEAENHCPAGVNQHFFYATVGFARSSDNGMTWPPYENSVVGGPLRHPALKSVNAQPAAGGYSAMGDAIPSAVVARNANGDYYLYVLYGYNDGGFTPSGDAMVRMARAKLGADPLNFQKWYNGSFSQPGIGGLDSGVLPGVGCTPNGRQHMPEVTYNDDLSQFLLLYVCESGATGARVGAWYYSTATSLELQDWTAPQAVQGSQFPLTSPCTGLTTGGDFDGYYPSAMSPGAAAGHTKATGRVFFINGCDTGARTFTSRTFTITIAP